MSAQQEQVLDYSWLHDDTEEDMVGADWHQDAIRAIGLALKTLARERQWPWHVGDQLTLIGDVPGRERWSPAPDISVHPTLGPAARRDLDLRVEGPPTLVVEVASPSTWAYDVSLERAWRGRRQVGKAYGYLMLLGVTEYLVFDPRQEYLSARAWRRGGVAARGATTAWGWTFSSRPAGRCYVFSNLRANPCPTGLGTPRRHGVHASLSGRWLSRRGNWPSIRASWLPRRAS